MSIENLARQASEFQTQTNDIARANDVKKSEFNPDKPLNHENKPNLQQGKEYDPDKLIQPEITDVSETNVQTRQDLENEYDPDILIDESKNNLDRIEQAKSEYIDDMISRSTCLDTIDKDKLKDMKIEKVEGDKLAELRKEFSLSKNKLIEKWESINHREWPRYEKDVYMETKDGPVLIRHAGDRHDAHHEHPLCMGGKNEVSNITPMHVLEHVDHLGVHGEKYDNLKSASEVRSI